MFNFERLGHASGSVYEVVTNAVTSRNQGFVAIEQFDRISADAEVIARMLSGLRNSLGVE